MSKGPIQTYPQANDGIDIHGYDTEFYYPAMVQYRFYEGCARQNNQILAVAMGDYLAMLRAGGKSARRMKEALSTWKRLLCSEDRPIPRYFKESQRANALRSEWVSERPNDFPNLFLRDGNHMWGLLFPIPAEDNPRWAMDLSHGHPREDRLVHDDLITMNRSEVDALYLYQRRTSSNDPVHQTAGHHPKPCLSRASPHHPEGTIENRFPELYNGVGHHGCTNKLGNRYHPACNIFTYVVLAFICLFHDRPGLGRGLTRDDVPSQVKRFIGDLRYSWNDMVRYIAVKYSAGKADDAQRSILTATINGFKATPDSNHVFLDIELPPLPSLSPSTDAIAVSASHLVVVAPAAASSNPRRGWAPSLGPEGGAKQDSREVRRAGQYTQNEDAKRQRLNKNNSK